MIDERERFERAFELFEMPEPALERLLSRRDRKRRNQRIAAGVVAGVMLLAVGAIFGRAWLTSEPQPADVPTPTPETSTSFESPFYGYSIVLPPDWWATPAEIVWAEGEPPRSDSLNAHVTREGSDYSFNVLIASSRSPTARPRTCGS